jgi:hypothetical protein
MVTTSDSSENLMRNNRNDEEMSRTRVDHFRSLLAVPRQISFSQRESTCGEILLVLLPYFILLIDVFVFFVLRGFQVTPVD